MSKPNMENRSRDILCYSNLTIVLSSNYLAATLTVSPGWCHTWVGARTFRKPSYCFSRVILCSFGFRYEQSKLILKYPSFKELECDWFYLCIFSAFKACHCRVDQQSSCFVCVVNLGTLQMDINNTWHKLSFYSSDIPETILRALDV